MKIRFGLNLDGQRGWANANRLGEPVLGPMGMLALLEEQLGLARQIKGRPARIMQYLNILKSHDNPSRFYHRTFAVDQIGTAATLLDWRDSWYLHGWDGGFVHPASQRLKDIGELEPDAATRVDPSIGQRLEKVCQAMAKRKPAIDVVELVDPLSTLPKRWREVLGQLNCQQETDASTPCGKGFLGQLQKALLEINSGKSAAKIAWQDDNSVNLRQAETGIFAGAWVARHIGGSGSQWLVVATAEGGALDEITSAAGMPRHGLSDASAFRPTLQVLRLALELLWEPVNYHALMQFLTHPICPVPKFARFTLAEKIAERPGISGAKWDEAISEIEEHYKTKVPPEDGKAKEAISAWITHKRYKMAGGAPVSKVCERVEMVKDYFRKQLANDDLAKRIASKSAFDQAAGLLEALEELKSHSGDKISPNQLQTLVTHATARGSGNPLLAPEAGCHLAVTDPAAVIEPMDNVVWWRPETPNLPPPYPWSASEIVQLKAAGAEIPAMDDVLAHMALSWLRPVMAARKSLTIVLPPEGVEPHPVWQMIKSIAEKPIIHKLEHGLTDPKAGGELVAHAPLPARRRWWDMPKGLIQANRHEDSFSSLEKFLFNPYHWVLQYKAKLEASKILSISDGFLMNGNLAHKLVESYYRQTNALSTKDAQFDAWFEVNFDKILEEEGATLLMLGNRSSSERLKLALKEAMKTLRAALKKSGIKKVTPELEMTGAYAGGKLKGYADLVLKNGKGQSAILDMKWSGLTKYRGKLENNSHLQLAIYANLVKQNNGAGWPHVAYFILQNAQIITEKDGFFQSAALVTKAANEYTEHLWDRFLHTWKWRKDQVENGKIEVALDKLEGNADSVPPANAMDMEYLNETYNDFLNLAGWSE